MNQQTNEVLWEGNPHTKQSIILCRGALPLPWRGVL